MERTSQTLDLLTAGWDDRKFNKPLTGFREGSGKLFLGAAGIPELAVSTLHAHMLWGDLPPALGLLHHGLGIHEPKPVQVADWEQEQAKVSELHLPRPWGPTSQHGFSSRYLLSVTWKGKPSPVVWYKCLLITCTPASCDLTQVFFSITSNIHGAIPTRCKFWVIGLIRILL